MAVARPSDGSWTLLTALAVQTVHNVVAGQTWRNISGNLPDAPVNDVIVYPRQPNRLYVATDVDVFGTRSGGVRWFVIGDGNLPLAPITDIEYHNETQQLTAATFGHSTRDRGVLRATVSPWSRGCRGWPGCTFRRATGGFERSPLGLG